MGMTSAQISLARWCEMRGKKIKIKIDGRQFDIDASALELLECSAKDSRTRGRPAELMSK